MKNMRRILALLLALSLCALFLGGCGKSTDTESKSTEPASNESTASAVPASAAPATQAPPAEVLTLKLAHGLPATSMTGQQYNAFCEALQEVSGGAVVVDQLVGGALLSDTETLDGVMDGTVDFVHNMVNYASGTIADVSPLCVPGYYAGDDYLGFAADVQTVLEDIYADYNIKYLGSNYQGTATLVCTEKQIKSPDDMKGLAFRSSGTWLGKAIEAWGASATTIALADLTTALERNTVQGSYNGWVITGPFALYEVAPYVTFTSIAESFAGLLMNMDTWEEMSDQQKAWVEEARDIYVQKSYDIGMGLFDQYYKTMEDAGTNLYTLTPEEEKAFTDMSTSLYDEIAGSCTSKGLALIDALNQMNAS